MGAGNSRTIGDYTVEVSKQIAEGGYSFVYLGKDGDKQFAVKKILCQDEEQLKAAHAEIDVYTALRGRKVSVNVAPMLASSIEKVSEGSEVYMLFPLYTGGCVFDVFTDVAAGDPWPFPEPEALRIFAGLLKGAQAMHLKGYSHRDIKPHNVMLATKDDLEAHGLSVPEEKSAADEEGAVGDEEQKHTGDEGAREGDPAEEKQGKRYPVPVLIDLGSVAPLEVKINNRQEALAHQELAEMYSTEPYRAPELHDVNSDCTITAAADVWSLGCTLYALAFGRCPFEDPEEGILKLWIMSGRVEFPENNEHHGEKFTSGFTKLISSMLQAKPEERPTLEQLLTTTQALLNGEALGGAEAESDFGEFVSGAPSEEEQAARAKEEDARKRAKVAEEAQAQLKRLRPQLRGLKVDTPMLKLGRKGQPHTRFFRLSDDGNSIEWRSKPKAKGEKLSAPGVRRLLIRDVQFLKEGQSTGVFQRFARRPAIRDKSGKSFSLVAKDRTLDVICENQESYDRWVNSLTALLQIKQ